MTLRSQIVIAGVLMGFGPGVVSAAPVPDPAAPITPGPDSEALPVAAPVSAPIETLPEPTPPVRTPAPAPFAGVRSPTAPPTAPGAPPTPLGPPPGTAGPQPYPTPGAEPRPGVDLGGMSITPLPPPPAALNPRTIRRQPWRGARRPPHGRRPHDGRSRQTRDVAGPRQHR